MKRFHSIAVVGAATFGWLVFAGEAAASHVTTFNGDGDGTTWEEDLNWSDIEPNATARAKIPAGFNVVVTTLNAVADSVEIEAGATVTIQDGAKLTLTFDEPRDSNINGELRVEKGGELFIEDSLAIIGDDGKITGLLTGGTATAKITGTGTLTIQGVQAGAPRSDSLLVHGNLDIQVALVNDAHVAADNGTLTLSGSAKSGDSGVWAAENDDLLLVDTTVSGTSTWQLVDDGRAVIRFNTANTTMSSHFDIQRGTLNVDADLDTTGDLDFQAVGKSHPRIEVAAGIVATFGS